MAGTVSRNPGACFLGTLSSNPQPALGPRFTAIKTFTSATTDCRIRINTSSACNWSLQKSKAFASTLDPNAESSMTHISSMKRS
ncbi:hypothetical protein FKM82_000402 [Ascaphus truei]